MERKPDWLPGFLVQIYCNSEVIYLPRPRKCRKVCCLPRSQQFIPEKIGNESVITMTVDEYEAIRLIDKQGFSQEECGAYMQVARTTIQQIYASARKKLADAIVDGAVLRIEGGDYQLCDGTEHTCGCGGCHRHRWANHYEQEDA